LKRSSTTGKETSNIQTNMKYFELKAFWTIWLHGKNCAT
jgi:hypothetical protein